MFQRYNSKKHDIFMSHFFCALIMCGMMFVLTANEKFFVDGRKIVEWMGKCRKIALCTSVTISIDAFFLLYFGLCFFIGCFIIIISFDILSHNLFKEMMD
jgi:nitrate reductase gamma subunit